MRAWHALVPTFGLGLLLTHVALPAEPWQPPTADTVIASIHPAVNAHWQQQTARLNPPQRLQQVQQLLRAAQQGDLQDGYGQAEAMLLALAKEAELNADGKLLLAFIQQHNHQFAAAEKLLNEVLQQQNVPSSTVANALLQRAQIALVTANYGQAQQDCQHLQALVSTALVESCLAQVAALTGKAFEARSTITALLQERQWAAADRYELLLTAATLAEQLGDNPAAVGYYQAALNHNSNDNFVRQHLSDLYLALQQPAAAAALLQQKPLTQLSLEQNITLAQALQAVDLPTAAVVLASLQAILAEATQRPESEQPMKELALFALWQGQAQQALAAAQHNWQQQKEPKDLLLLAQAARQANDSTALAQVRAWMQHSQWQDVRIHAVLQEAGL